jgi:hypothetical protein
MVATSNLELCEDYINIHNTPRLSIFEAIAPITSKRRGGKKKSHSKKQ